MSKMEKSLKKHIFSTIWAILIMLLLAGAWYHKGDFTQFWALWGTECLAFALIALYFWRPNAISAFSMGAGSIVWLVNQLVGWYNAEVFRLLNQPVNLQVVAASNFITFAVEGVLLYYSFSHKKGGGKPPIKFASVETTAMLGLIIMASYSAVKMYWTQTYSVNIPLIGQPIYISGMMWAGGIAIMAVASIINMKVRKENTITMIIGVIGLLAASYAALYYGLALALTGI